MAFVGLSLYKELRYEEPLTRSQSAALAKTDEPRQRYTKEAVDLITGTALLRWSFKPDPTDKEYQQQFVVWRASESDYFYYYNPQTRKFWGRLYKPATGEPRYSTLPQESRRSTIGDTTDFPKPGPLPTLPDATDDAKIEPPDFLPFPGNISSSR